MFKGHANKQLLISQVSEYLTLWLNKQLIINILLNIDLPTAFGLLFAVFHL